MIQRRDEAKAFETYFRQAPEGFREIQGRDEGERVWLKQLPPQETDGIPLARVLCHSQGRAEKERGIDRLKEKRLLEDLGLRPIRHHGDDRTRAHLFVSVLAYHLVAAIERTLREQGDHRTWATLRKQLATHQRSTVSVKGEAGSTHQVRLSGRPEPVHQEIYRLLDVKDPLARRHRYRRNGLSTGLYRGRA